MKFIYAIKRINRNRSILKIRQLLPIFQHTAICNCAVVTCYREIRDIIVINSLEYYVV